MNFKKLTSYLGLLFLGGCAGLSKDCSSCSAESFGADWVIVQQSSLTGQAIKCWQLHNVSVSNEAGSDGIFWKDEHGNLVHISGNYNRIQVLNGKFKEAADSLDVVLEKCKGGSYEGLVKIGVQEVK